jgi:hypothetical protein
LEPSSRNENSLLGWETERTVLFANKNPEEQRGRESKVVAVKHPTIWHKP